MPVSSSPAPAPAHATMPRLGFLGVGWIGRSRMLSLARAGVAEVAAVADADRAARTAAARDLPEVEVLGDLEDLLNAGLDGVVIATPSALHAEQSVAALEHEVAVFCQKPLARSATETRRVVAAARQADRLLGVDLSYRQLRATIAAERAASTGELGEIYAIELAFHNAYGPDKPWFTSRRLAGGGCLIDLGTHLVDLALWLSHGDTARVESARVLAGGRRLRADTDQVEDFALAQILIDERVTARIACSWNLHAGTDCAFECTVHGTQGAVCVRNVGGSFYDFAAHRHQGTAAQPLVGPPDEWGPRAILSWTAALADGQGFDPAADRLVVLAEILDDIYAAAA